MHQALKRKGVTLQLLWAEYVAVHGGGYRYSQCCNRYRQWRDRQKRSLRQIHRAGEKLFIDYCGPNVPIVDRHTGECREAQIFVSVLGASSYTYAEATYTHWIASHQRALAFYGGVVGPQYSCSLRKIGVVKAVNGWEFHNVAGFRCSYGATVRRVAIQGLVEC